MLGLSAALNCTAAGPAPQASAGAGSAELPTRSFEADAQASGQPGAGAEAPVAGASAAESRAQPASGSGAQDGRAEQAGASAGAPAAQGGGGAAAAGRAGTPAVGAAGGGAPAAPMLAAGAPAADSGPVTVYIASDSTASAYADTDSPDDQAGWGQMLHEFVRADTRIDNRAIGGRTARRFIDEGRLDDIWQDLKPGDYLLVQFGTNDGNRNASYTIDGRTIPYYLDPATDFKSYLKRYVTGTREREGILVFVTPPPRNSAYCTGGNGTGAHAQAMRELAEDEQVLVVDLNSRTVDYLQAICPAPDPPDFFLQRPDGSVDGTHFQERGARKLAEFVAQELRDAALPWAIAQP